MTITFEFHQYSIKWFRVQMSYNYFKILKMDKNIRKLFQDPKSEQMSRNGLPEVLKRQKIKRRKFKNVRVLLKIKCLFFFSTNLYFSGLRNLTRFSEIGVTWIFWHFGQIFWHFRTQVNFLTFSPITQSNGPNWPVNFTSNDP